MKTVAKKVAKKAPIKAQVKATAKVAAKPVVKKTAKVPAKAVKKTVTKPVVKAAAKKVAKPVAKKITKPLPKAKAKAKAVKAVVAPVKKPAKKAQTVAVKSKESKIIKTAKVAKAIKTVIANKAVKAKKPINIEKPAKPAKASKIAKAESKPTTEELKSKQPMVIASKSAPTEPKLATKSTAIEPAPAAPAAPVLSKARTSRLASLTVPSMAQSIASTAAKSSYGPAVHSQVFIVPPQNAPKQNPKLANNWKNKTAEEMSDEELLAMPESEYMNIKQMMYFRLKLIELKKGILESAGATTEHLRDDSAVVPDPTDRATIEEEHALELRTRDRERKLLKKIEQSIARIDAGDYGYCDETGEAIGVGRLLARPTATLSLEAQQRRELKQKMFGD